MAVTGSSRKVRLDRLVELARMYRGLNRTQLSERLGRDPSKLVPESGNPKLDFVAGIADTLDWRLGDVAESIWEGPPEADPGGRSFAELDAAALAAHRAGDARGMLALADGMRRIAAEPAERATAANRESGAYDLLGRYTKSLEALRRGLAEPAILPSTRLMLEANLANAHYALWNLPEARAIAGGLVAELEERQTRTRIERVGRAFALYVRGNSLRRELPGASESRVAELAARARRDLVESETCYRGLADEFGDRSYEAVADTCRAGILECACALGLATPLGTLGEVLAKLEEVTDPEAFPAGDRLESYGWWAIVGCNIALRHLEGHDLHRTMAICTNKAFEIAERLDNWSIRERAFTMERFRRERVTEATGFEPDWLLDPEDVRLLAGTMGRFPSFRETGWRILDSARIFGESEETR
jgi:hypothetical protein